MDDITHYEAIEEARLEREDREATRRQKNSGSKARFDRKPARMNGSHRRRIKRWLM
jgi:hypothetical protein